LTHLLKPLLILIVAVGIFILAYFSQLILAQTPESEGTSPPDFFLEAEVDNQTPYRGQQITYVVRRYQAIEFPNQPYFEDHPFTGFWDTPLIQRPSYTTTISGREYVVRPTYLALFATLPGPITIPPAKLIIPGDGPEADIVIESEPIDIQVRPLPENAPANFQGAVGQFEIKANFDKPESQVDSPISLITEISGTGNIHNLPNPLIPNLEHWHLLGAPMNSVTTDIPLSKEKVKGTRRFEWPIVPTQSGQQFFPVIRFSYFDPETESYHSIRTDPISINILPDPNTSTFTSPIAESRQELRHFISDIRHIKPVPTTLDTKSTLSKVRTLGFWSCVIFPVLVVSSTWFWQNWRRRYLADTPDARRRRAKYRAKNVLVGAQQPNANPYTTVRKALIGYLSDKLEQPITGLTSDQLKGLLNEALLSPELAERVHTLLNRVDTGRFAPVTDEQTTSRSLIASARVLIDDLEKFFSQYEAKR